MAGDGTSTDSQAALDRHLAELIAQEQQFDASINASTATATPRSHAGESVSVDQLRSDFVSSIRAGMRVPEDIYSESGILLLASGSKITPRFLHLLNRHGITRVRLGAPQAPLPVGPEVNLDEELHTPRSRSLDKNLARELEKTVTYRPIKAWRRPRLTIDDLKGEAARGLEKHQATSTAVSDLCDALRVGRRISVTEIREAVDQFVTMSTVDFDLLPLIVAMQRTKNDYLYDHCVNVALLSPGPRRTAWAGPQSYHSGRPGRHASRHRNAAGAHVDPPVGRTLERTRVARNPPPPPAHARYARRPPRNSTGGEAHRLSGP